MKPNKLSIYGKFRQFPLSLRLACGYLFIVFLFAILGNLIANDVPIVIKTDGRIEWPIKDRALFMSKIAQKDSITFNIYPPVKYYYSTLDQETGLVGPGKKSLSVSNQSRHWLGTDTYTRDVLSGIIHGSKIAIWVGLISTLISCLLGLLLGSLAGYFADNKWRLNRYLLISLIIISSIYVYLIFWNKSLLLFYRFDILLILAAVGLGYLVFKIRSNEKNKISIPIDSIIMKVIEIFQSIPGLFLLICLISIFETSNVIKLSLIIGLLRWPTFTRLVRGETFKIRHTEYVQSARALGIANYGIILKHIWPNLFRQVLVAFSYGVGSAVLLEASLSFLGIGLTPDSVSWGSLLSQSRLQVNAWWLALFPGMMITFLIASCYTIGSYLIKGDKEKITSII